MDSDRPKAGRPPQSASEKISDLEKQVEYFRNLEARRGKHMEGKLLILEAFQRQQAMADIYQNVLEVIIDITGYSSGLIQLMHPNSPCVYLVASKNIPTGFLNFFDIERTEEKTLKPLFDGNPYGIGELDDLVEGLPEIFKNGDIDLPSAVRIPLTAENRVIGALTLFNRKDHKGQVDAETDWLSAIGRQVGILIGHVQLSEQMQNEAILRERERLSQELHDNLSQSVSTIRLLSERLVKKFESEDAGNIKKDIEVIEKIAQDTYADIREEMTGLRFVEESSRDIVSLVKEYLTVFRRQWGIEYQFETRNFGETTVISPYITIQLFRMVQESLTNIRKHSRAANVNILLEIKDDRLITLIQDDGTGFDPAAIPADRLGIKILHERAETLGGTLKITSVSDSGTLVEIDLPTQI